MEGVLLPLTYKLQIFKQPPPQKNLFFSPWLLKSLSLEDVTKYSADKYVIVFYKIQCKLQWEFYMQVISRFDVCWALAMGISPWKS